MKSKAEKLRDKKYYSLAHRGSTDMSHPAMPVLLKLFQQSEKILDLGCGEGTRLATLIKKEHPEISQKIYGVDASEIAIRLAKKNYPGITFKVGDLEKLPFKDKEFNLLISAYVFEHLINPEKVIIEARRLLAEGGKFMIIAPNFGSPNRRSPNSTEGKFKKLWIGWISDLKLLDKKNGSLNWTRVTPRHSSYITDADTTIEPYILSLLLFCQSQGFVVEYYSSNWKVDRFSFFQLLFRIPGVLGIYPFKYWGPHLTLVLRR